MVSPNAVLAEDPEAPWREALGNDQLIQATKSRVQAAQAELDAAKSNRLPVVSATTMADACVTLWHLRITS